MLIGPAAPDKKGVAEAIEILNHLGTYGFRAGKSDGEAFRAAADGPAHMQFRIDARTARKNE